MPGGLDHFRDMPNANKIKWHADHGKKVARVEPGFGGVDHEIKTRFAQTKPTLVKVQQKFSGTAQERTKQPD